jgi:DNA-binding NtrC family response regulator
MSAAEIHRASKRRNGPFVSHNAANCTLSLLEAELFGNVANYPNAGMPARRGLIAAANGGTLFLDEIGDLPLEAQAMLLRVLDAGEYRTLGDSTPRRVDIRVVGATNRDVSDESVFRRDLLARFGRTIRIPPLRERREDIPLLVRHWLLRRAHQDPVVMERFTRMGPAKTLEPRISGRLIDYLVRQPLPLNVRELNALLEKALDASKDGEADEVKLPSSMPSWNTSPPSEAPEVGRKGETDDGGGDDPSKEQVLAALAAAEGNVSRAAKRLGVHRNTLSRLMKKFEIKRDETAP